MARQFPSLNWISIETKRLLESWKIQQWILLKLWNSACSADKKLISNIHNSKLGRWALSNEVIGRVAIDEIKRLPAKIYATNAKFEKWTLLKTLSSTRYDSKIINCDLFWSRFSRWELLIEVSGKVTLNIMALQRENDENDGNESKI